MEVLNDIPTLKRDKKNANINNEDHPNNQRNENIKEKLNLDKPLIANEETEEFNEIQSKLESSKKIENYLDLLHELEKIGKNLEELMLDVDKKMYYNLELKEKIENIEKDIQDMRMLMEEVLLTGEKAVIYYLKRNKNKPIKLKELYKKFDRHIVNKVIEKLYDKGLIKIIK